ncbi:MAG: gliding motility-associated C-terminal domain-containing protein [Bacteroidota bacterium]
MRNSLLLLLSIIVSHAWTQNPVLVVDQHALYGTVEGVDMTGYIIHDVFVEFPNSNYRLTTLGAGWANSLWKVTTDCNFFHASNSGYSSEQIPCASAGLNTLAELSSRWMIGGACNGLNDGVLYSMGGDGTVLNNWGTGNFNSLNHVLFRIPTDPLSQTSNNRIQIGRFTTCGNVCVDAGIQYFENYNGPGSVFQTAQLSGCFSQPCLLNPIPTTPIVQQIGCTTASQLVSMIQGGNGNSNGNLYTSAGVFVQSVGIPNGLLFLSGLEANTYYLSIQDEVGCRDTTNLFEVPNFEPLQISENHVNVTCFSGANGGVELSYTGGTSPVTWVNDSSVLPLQISNLESNNYWFVVSDDNGCLDSVEVFLSEPNEIELTVLGTSSTTCFNSCDGQINWMVSGGTGLLSLSLNGAQQQGSLGQFSNVCAGNSLVQITDEQGCIVQRNVFVDSPPEIVADIQLIQPLCPENSEGSVQFNFSGGTGNLDPNFSAGNFIEYPLSLNEIQLQQVTPQSIFYSVVDDNNCAVVDTLIVEPIHISELTFTTLATPETCWNTNDGSATIELVNASGSESISWNDDVQQATFLASNLNGNRSYTVTVTDDNGCVFKRDVFFPLVDGCIFIAELISPNGDGANDTWFIGGLEGYANAKVQVLSRWGQIVFESTGYSTPWDGKYQNEYLPPADYYFVVQYDEERDPITGVVTIAYE